MLNHTFVQFYFSLVVVVYYLLGIVFISVFCIVVKAVNQISRWVITSPSLNKEFCIVLYCIDRRGAIAAKLFYEICANQSHSLHKLLPRKYQPSYSLREQRIFIRPKRKTERCKNRFSFKLCLQ